MPHICVVGALILSMHVHTKTQIHTEASHPRQVLTEADRTADAAPQGLARATCADTKVDLRLTFEIFQLLMWLQQKLLF